MTLKLSAIISKTGAGDPASAIPSPPPFGILTGLLMDVMIQCVHIAMKAGPVMILVQRGNNQILESIIWW
ncbi:MAG: hypothetical protein R6U68_02135 [Desulfobacteraceae bacterium]